MEILLPVVAIGGLGLIFGIILSVAAKIFAVEKDERIPLVSECLPGANCGGCGYAGCAAAAEAIVKGEAKVNCCPVGGDAVAAKIAEIMGVSAEKSEKMVAFVMCSGGPDVAKNKYDINEKVDCRTANRLSGGMKECAFGCLGFGSCVEKCAFDAISIKDGVAVVDPEKCTNCGACIGECPKKIIKSIPYDTKVVVRCNSKAKGKETRNACQAGCIGCGICAKNCESGAITLENNLASIDKNICTNCGVCMEKCPRKIIKVFRGEPEIQVAKAANR